jgi:hypothetical protein
MVAQFQVQTEEITYESPLSDSELTEKLFLERKIERSLSYEIEKWRALRTLIEKRLYRPLTKAEYCKTRWGFSEDAGEIRVYAARMVDAIEEKALLEVPTKSRVLPFPEKLDQVRAYRGLPIEVSLELYEKAVEENNGRPPGRRISDRIVKQHRNSSPGELSSLSDRYSAYSIVKVKVEPEEEKATYCRIANINQATITVWQRDMKTDELISRRFGVTEFSCPSEGVEDELMQRIAAIEETSKCQPIDVDICTLLKRAVFLTASEEKVLQEIEKRVGLRKDESENVPALDPLQIVPLLKKAKSVAQQLSRCQTYKEVQTLFLEITDEQQRTLVKNFTLELLTEKQKDRLNRLKFPFRKGEIVIYDGSYFQVEIEGQAYTKLYGVPSAIPNSFLSLSPEQEVEF